MSRSYKSSSYSTRWDKYERKYSTRRERMQKRNFCNKSKQDEELSFSEDIEKREPTWGHNWYGYWQPMRRWLLSHIGQNWNQVHSELVKKIKTHTNRADIDSIQRYIRNYVEIAPDPRFARHLRDDGTSFFRWDFYVDDNGLLQLRKCMARKHYSHPRYNTHELAEWLDGRIIGYQGNQLFWFVPVTKNKKYNSGYSRIWKCDWSYTDWSLRYGLIYLYQAYEPILDKDNKTVIGHREVWKKPFLIFKKLNARQQEPLSKEDAEFFEQLPKFYRDQILAWSPTNPVAPEIKYW